MGLRNVCLLTLFLATFQSSMMAYPTGNVESSSSSEEMLNANEYLGYLFQKIEVTLQCLLCVYNYRIRVSNDLCTDSVQLEVIS